VIHALPRLHRYEIDRELFRPCPEQLFDAEAFEQRAARRSIGTLDAQLAHKTTKINSYNSLVRSPSGIRTAYQDENPVSWAGLDDGDWGVVRFGGREPSRPARVKQAHQAATGAR